MKHLKDVDIVVTGEGATDWQSVFGKVHAGSWCTLQKRHISSCSDCSEVWEAVQKISSIMELNLLSQR